MRFDLWQIGLAMVAIALGVAGFKSQRVGIAMLAVGLVVFVGGMVWKFRAVPAPPPAPPIIINSTPTAAPAPIDWAAVLMRGNPVVLTIDDISPFLGNPNFIEHQAYDVTFSAERCEWTVVGTMTYSYPQYGLVPGHRRIYGPLIEKPYLSAAEVRSGSECLQPTTGAILFVGLPLRFDANGTLTTQVINPAQYGSITIPRRVGHLSLRGS